MLVEETAFLLLLLLWCISFVENCTHLVALKHLSFLFLKVLLISIIIFHIIVFILNDFVLCIRFKSKLRRLFRLLLFVHFDSSIFVQLGLGRIERAMAAHF